MTTPLEKRPVKADPPGTRIAFIDPATGVLTPHGLRVMTNLWRRTGGFNDDLDSVLATTLLSQVSSLTASSNEEKVRRTLETALQQIQAQGVERVRALLEDNKKTSDTNYAQLLGGLARPPQTRVIQFTGNDTWRLNPDVRAIQVILVAGGGGGGSGSTAPSGPGGGGGAGGGYSTAFFNAATLPSSVSITVGAGGAGGTGGSAGNDGGNSSFGTLIGAIGGTKGSVGVSVGTGGVANTSYGSLFFGGNGANGTTTDGLDAPNVCQGAPGGGGGGGFSSGNGGDGGAGSWRASASTGGGGLGGATGTNGAAGSLPVSADVYLGPGLGGGGGGGASTGDGGNGGAGVLGGGGGGGGAIGTSGVIEGSGGAGGDGRVWVLEYY